jgi:hypothetical protein
MISSTQIRAGSLYFCVVSSNNTNDIGSVRYQINNAYTRHGAPTREEKYQQLRLKLLPQQ